MWRFGAVNSRYVASNVSSSFYVSSVHSSYPTQLCMSTQVLEHDDDDVTFVMTSNAKTYTTGSYRSCALSLLLQKEFAGTTYHLHNNNAITNSSATQISAMEGSDVVNKRWTTCPLKVALEDSHQVMSTHMCDIHIDGLPFTLTGQILPNLSIALLFGIWALTEVECEVSFDKHKCIVWYNGKIILSGDKDPATDLWTLPLGSTGRTSDHNDVVIPFVAPVVANTHANLTTQIAFFAHTVQNKANSIRFAHQSLCSQCISTLLKAI